MSSGTASAPGSALSAFQQPPDISSPVIGASQQQSAAAGQQSSEASELHQQAAAPHEAGRLSQEAGRLPHGLQLQQLQSNLLRPAMPQLAKAAGAALGLADQGLVHLLLRKLFSCLSSLVVGHRATRSKSTMHKTSKVCLRGCPVY